MNTEMMQRYWISIAASESRRQFAGVVAFTLPDGKTVETITAWGDTPEQAVDNCVTELTQAKEKHGTITMYGAVV